MNFYVAYEYSIRISRIWKVAKAAIVKRVGGNGADERHNSIRVHAWRRIATQEADILAIPNKINKKTGTDEDIEKNTCEKTTNQQPIYGDNKVNRGPASYSLEQALIYSFVFHFHFETTLTIGFEPNPRSHYSRWSWLSLGRRSDRSFHNLKWMS